MPQGGATAVAKSLIANGRTCLVGKKDSETRRSGWHKEACLFLWGNAGASTSTAGDANHDGQITIDEILAAVNNALNGCTHELST
ncbi:MAG: hypothetical protein ACHQ4J_12525 [Candidatus Binatia bacterium]